MFKPNDQKVESSSSFGPMDYNGKRIQCNYITWLLFKVNICFCKNPILIFVEAWAFVCCNPPGDDHSISDMTWFGHSCTNTAANCLIKFAMRSVVFRD